LRVKFTRFFFGNKVSQFVPLLYDEIEEESKETGKVWQEVQWLQRKLKHIDQKKGVPDDIYTRNRDHFLSLEIAGAAAYAEGPPPHAP
jgi:hypothetical protein